MNSAFPRLRAPQARRLRAWPLHALPLLALLACAWGLPGRAMAANECWFGALSDVSFGSVSGGGGTSSGTITYICQNDGPAQRTFRICLYANPSYPTGVAPRRLIRMWTPEYLNYDLYADPAMSQLVGSETSGHAVQSITRTTTSTGQVTGTIPYYARIPAGQTVSAGSYIGQNNLVLRAPSQSGAAAPSVGQCPSGPQNRDYFEVYANYANTCFVSAATDMDFGAVASLAGNRDQTSTISLRCPNNTEYQVALNYGNYSTGGTNRRMLGPGGNYINYQLYRNAARTQVWGNSTSNDVEGDGNNAIQTLTVYGRVPAQAVGSAGTYSDTVTITLTY